MSAETRNASKLDQGACEIFTRRKIGRIRSPRFVYLAARITYCENLKRKMSGVHVKKGLVAR